MAGLSPQLAAYNQYVGNMSQGQSAWAPQNTVLYSQATGNYNPANSPRASVNQQMPVSTAPLGGGGLGPTGATGNSNIPQPGPNPMDAYKNEISSNWDSYLGSLNDQNTNLQGQQTAQNNIVNTQYDQGVNSLNQQKTKSLQDIGNNIKSAFQAGNNFLGARGAGDSSAADQYSYALNKEAGKQTSNLNEFVTGHMQNLQSQRDTQINQIASWFNDAQNQLQDQIRNGKLNKGKDLQSLSSQILNQAIAATQQVHQDAQNRYNALVQWASQNATSMGDLQNQISQIPQPVGQPVVDSTGNTVIPTGYGGPATQDKDLFGNPIRR